MKTWNIDVVMCKKAWKEWKAITKEAGMKITKKINEKYYRKHWLKTDGLKASENINVLMDKMANAFSNWENPTMDLIINVKVS